MENEWKVNEWWMNGENIFWCILSRVRLCCGPNQALVRKLLFYLIIQCLTDGVLILVQFLCLIHVSANPSHLNQNYPLKSSLKCFLPWPESFALYFHFISDFLERINFMIFPNFPWGIFVVGDYKIPISVLELILEKTRQSKRGKKSNVRFFSFMNFFHEVFPS